SKEEKADKVELFFRCIAGGLFLLTFVHPGVSTSVMHIFNCDPYWYTDAGGQQSFVIMGSDIECYTTRWWGAIVVALFTCVVYIVGLPLGLGIFMTRKRRFVKCRIENWAYESSLENMLEKRLWRKCLNQIEMFESLKESPPNVLDLQPPTPEDLFGLRAEFRQEAPTVPSEAETPMNFREQTLNKCKDVYIHRDMLERVEEDSPWIEKAQCITARPHQEGSIESLGAVCAIQLLDGSTCAVIMYEKEEVGENDAVSMKTVTEMDSEYVNQALGTTFTDPFEDEFFYWQCYEIVRRFMQTGAVLLVKMAFSSETNSVAYATLMAIIAFCLFLRFRPFKDDNDDALMTVILLNQMICQYLLMCISLTGQGREALGVVLVVCQIRLVQQLFLDDATDNQTPISDSLGVQQLSLDDAMMDFAAFKRMETIVIENAEKKAAVSKWLPQAEKIATENRAKNGAVSKCFPQAVDAQNTNMAL
ncbi:hypothetical protein CYMTET_45846, partial [Cymbomonas tetramitiformis]